MLVIWTDTVTHNIQIIISKFPHEDKQVSCNIDQLALNLKASRTAFTVNAVNKIKV